MTLRRTMGYQIGGMIVGLLLIGGASLWGLNGLTQEFDSAVAGYEELREVYDAGARVTTAKALLTLSARAAPQAVAELGRGGGKGTLGPEPAAGSGRRRTELRRAMRASLLEADRMLRYLEMDRATAAEAIEALGRVLDRGNELAGEIRREIEAKQAAAESRRRATMGVMAALSGLVVLAAAAVGAAQYRSVMHPLARLGEGVRRIAAGRFADRVRPEGHAEFAALAVDFNRMAGELDGLYRELEQKVAAKSRELVRSERLASVGYLAAGVAHEISNPIGIIAGYAELSLQELRRRREAGAAGGRGNDGGAEENGETEQSLRMIGEEAFRCKEIVAKLLSLARPGEENRKAISLGGVAANVVSVVRGLGEFKSRRLAMKIVEGDDLRVVASEGEMKQVLLNLVINALEATSPEGGEVTIALARRDGAVELAVRDNGRGMTPEVLERVFEPFFTEKRGVGPPGTGLGLSITHAIVESHGGSIRAESDGAGKGSRFVVRLPAG